MFIMLCLVFYFNNFALIEMIMKIRWDFLTDGVTQEEIEETEGEEVGFQMYFWNKGGTWGW